MYVCLKMWENGNKKVRRDSTGDQSILMTGLSEDMNSSNVMPDITVCKLMFSSSWYASLATFSVVLETSTINSHIKDCLNGYNACIKLALYLDKHTECEAFVSSLRRFTLLGVHLKDNRRGSGGGSGGNGIMEHKNIEAIKILLDIAYTHGNYLRDEWKHILFAVSEIELLHLIANKAVADAAFYIDPASDALDSLPPTPSYIYIFFCIFFVFLFCFLMFVLLGDVSSIL